MKHPFTSFKIKGGEGGIRTHDTLRYTRFPSGRVRPDCATSPRLRDQAPILYHFNKKLPEYHLICLTFLFSDFPYNFLNQIKNQMKSREHTVDVINRT